MDDVTVIELGVQAFVIAGKLAIPLLLTSLIVGFAISLFQSVTQIQEVTLSFVPKALAVMVVVLVMGSWMLREATTYTTELYESIPLLLRGG